MDNSGWLYSNLHPVPDRQAYWRTPPVRKPSPAEMQRMLAFDQSDGNCIWMTECMPNILQYCQMINFGEVFDETDKKHADTRRAFGPEVNQHSALTRHFSDYSVQREFLRQQFLDKSPWLDNPLEADSLLKNFSFYGFTMAPNKNGVTDAKISAIVFYRPYARQIPVADMRLLFKCVSEWDVSHIMMITRTTLKRKTRVDALSGFPGITVEDWPPKLFLFDWYHNRNVPRMAVVRSKCNHDKNGETALLCRECKNVQECVLGGLRHEPWAEKLPMLPATPDNILARRFGAKVNDLLHVQRDYPKTFRHLHVFAPSHATVDESLISNQQEGEDDTAAQDDENSEDENEEEEDAGADLDGMDVDD